MKLGAQIDDHTYEVEIKRDGSRVSASVDGREYELEASEPESAVYLLKHENRVFEVYVSPDGIVNVGGHQLEVKISDPKRLRGARGDVEHGDGTAEIKTAMPGKIVRILVAEGDEVEKGDGVIVVEALKMQNEMKAPKAGVVKQIGVKEGDTVNAGDILAAIE
jgi:biotin carboxyl carrier protein